MDSGPGESEDDRKARLRERRLSLLERRRSAEEGAGGLTTDLRAVYGLQNLWNYGRRGSYTTPAATPTSTAPTQKLNQYGSPIYSGR